MIYILGVLLGFIVFCLVVVILLQEGKGGGITAMGGAAMDNFIGAKNPLRKITVIFSIIFLVLVLAIGVSINNQKADNVINKSLKTEPDIESEQPAVNENTVKKVEKKEVTIPELPSDTAKEEVTDKAAEPEVADAVKEEVKNKTDEATEKAAK